MLLPLLKPIVLKPCPVLFCDQVINHKKWMYLPVLVSKDDFTFWTSGMLLYCLNMVVVAQGDAV